MAGWYDFVNGQTLPASQVQDYLMDQSVMVFADETARNAALGDGTDGMTVYLVNRESLYNLQDGVWVQLLDTTNAASLLATYVPTRRNAIINGGFDIWQRGTSINFSGAGGYAADRWKSDSGSGGVLAVTRQTFTPGQTDVPEATFFLQAAYTTSGSGSVVLEQRIENVVTFAGQTVTFSFYAKVNTGTKNVTPRLVQDFGSGGSSTVVTNLTAQTLTTNWQRFTVTATVPSITGKTVGTYSYLRVDLESGTTGVTTYSFANVQLEAGSVATPFVRAGGTLQGELAACQRYYQRITHTAGVQPLGNGSYFTSTAFYMVVPLPVVMRSAPTFARGAANGLDIYSNGGARVTTAITARSSTPQAVTFEITTAAATAGNSGWAESNSAFSWYEMNSEL